MVGEGGFDVGATDLAGILDDAFTLARAGLQPSEAFLNLTTALGGYQVLFRFVLFRFFVHYGEQLVTEELHRK